MSNLLENDQVFYGPLEEFDIADPIKLRIADIETLLPGFGVSVNCLDDQLSPVRVVTDAGGVDRRAFTGSPEPNQDELDLTRVVRGNVHAIQGVLAQKRSRDIDVDVHDAGFETVIDCCEDAVLLEERTKLEVDDMNGTLYSSGQGRGVFYLCRSAL